MAVAVPADVVQLAEGFDLPTCGGDYESTCDAFLQLQSLQHCVAFTQLVYVSSLVEQQRAVYDDENNEIAAYGVAEFLHYKGGLSWPKAKEMVRVALACRALPITTQAYADCLFGWEYLTLLTRFLTPETEHELIESLDTYSIKQLRRLARRSEASEGESQDAYERRSLRMSSNETTGFINGELPLHHFVVVRDAIDRIADAEGPDAVTGEYRPQGERRADALLTIAGAAIADDADPDRATVSIHVDLDSLLVERRHGAGR